MSNLNFRMKQGNHGNLEMDISRAVPIRDVKPGEYIKRKPDANRVFIKGHFDRASKTFSCVAADDMNYEIFIKSGRKVFVDFTY